MVKYRDPQTGEGVCDDLGRVFFVLLGRRPGGDNLVQVYPDRTREAYFYGPSANMVLRGRGQTGYGGLMS